MKKKRVPISSEYEGNHVNISINDDGTVSEDYIASMMKAFEGIKTGEYLTNYSANGKTIIFKWDVDHDGKVTIYDQGAIEAFIAGNEKNLPNNPHKHEYTNGVCACGKEQ